MPRHTDSRQRLLAIASDLVWRRSYYGTTVDMICERCGIKKGSFYHHFASKEELMVHALDGNWEAYRLTLDAAFSASRSPAERFRFYTDNALNFQKLMLEKEGKVLGCPLFSLGAEIGTQEPILRARIDAHLSTLSRYFASAVREGIAAGQFSLADADETAQLLLAYEEGALTLARIRNDLHPVELLADGFSRILRLAALPLLQPTGELSTPMAC